MIFNRFFIGSVFNIVISGVRVVIFINIRFVVDLKLENIRC